MYTIRIKDLKANVTLGVYDWEKTAPREVILNIELDVPESGASTSDQLEDAVDYATIESRILTHLAANKYQLIEKMVTDLGHLILAQDPRITRVHIEADKPGALRAAPSVSVATELKR